MKEFFLMVIFLMKFQVYREIFLFKWKLYRFFRYSCRRIQSGQNYCFTLYISNSYFENIPSTLDILILFSIYELICCSMCARTIVFNNSILNHFFKRLSFFSNSKLFSAFFYILIIIRIHYGLHRYLENIHISRAYFISDISNYFGAELKIKRIDK